MGNIPVSGNGFFAAFKQILAIILSAFFLHSESAHDQQLRHANREATADQFDRKLLTNFKLKTLKYLGGLRG